MNIAIVLVDKMIDPLAPMEPGSCIASLPVAGKPMIHYVLEQLIASGISQCYLVTGEDDLEIRRAISTKYWSMAVGFVAKLQDALAVNYSQDRWLIRGDCIVSEPKEPMYTPSQHSYIAYIAQQKALVFFKAGFMPPFVTTWDDLDGLELAKRNITGHYISINSLQGYQKLNLQVCNAMLCIGRMAGRQRCPGFRTMPGASVCASSLACKALILGRDSYVAPSALISGVAVLGDRVYVDHGAVLQNVVVMPDTYVGKGVSLQNAIISSRGFLRIDTGVFADPEDKRLLMSVS